MASETEIKAAGGKYIPKDYDPKLYKLRHSLAHVLAQAVVEKFPQAKPTIGPPIEFGFFVPAADVCSSLSIHRQALKLPRSKLGCEVINVCHAAFSSSFLQAAKKQLTSRPR